MQEKRIRNELHAYIAATMKANQSPAVIVNSMPDHVHVLFQLSRNIALSDLVREIKTSSSKWLKRQSPETTNFTWQSGSGVFSVSESNVAQVRNYIANQEQHHQKLSFKEEFRRICQKHDIHFDEQYVWD